MAKFKRTASKNIKARPARSSLSVLSSLMMPEDANPMGKVFGGSVLKLIDNAAYVAACRHASTANCVTVSFDKVDFKLAIEIGELVILEAKLHFAGKTSMQVGVLIYAEDLNTGSRRPTNSCLVTLVAVDKLGRPRPVPKVVAETEEEKQLYQAASLRYQSRR